MSDLEAVFDLDSTENPHRVLEDIVTRVLYRRDVWEWGASDGLVSYRVTEHSPTRVRLRGKIIEITKQTLHAFWLDVDRDDAAPGRLHWTLYFDIDPTGLSERRVRNLIDAIDEPGQIAWRTTLRGSEEADPTSPPRG